MQKENYNPNNKTIHSQTFKLHQDAIEIEKIAEGSMCRTHNL